MVTLFIRVPLSFSLNIFILGLKMHNSVSNPNLVNNEL